MALRQGVLWRVKRSRHCAAQTTRRQVPGRRACGVCLWKGCKTREGASPMSGRSPVKQEAPMSDHRESPGFSRGEEVKKMLPSTVAADSGPSSVTACRKRSSNASCSGGRSAGAMPCASSATKLRLRATATAASAVSGAPLSSPFTATSTTFRPAAENSSSSS